MSIYKCKSCNESHFVYRSCRNRFCATCGVVETYDWCERLLQQILPTKHHHIVMTLPRSLRSLVKENSNKLYDILFRTSAKSLQEWFQSKHKLTPGIVSVLHTSGSDLKLHPHIHMIVSSGGLLLKDNKMKCLPGKYLVAQRTLADLFKKAYLKELKKEFKKGEIKLNTAWTSDSFVNKIQKLEKEQWIVNIEPPLEDSQQIIGYVGRYTKRACISEYKLQNIKGGKISFLYNDYKNTPRGEKPRVSTRSYEAEIFLDKLLTHVPNKRFKMVRYYGVYTSRYRKLLPKKQTPLQYEAVELEHTWGEYESYRKRQIDLGNPDPLQCPKCGTKMELEGIIYSDVKFIDDS